MTVQEPIDVVRDFYSAIQRKDIAALTAILGTAFAEDAIVRLPESLYYGGEYKGRESLERLFSGLAHPKSAVDADSMTMDHIIGNDEQVVVVLSFQWRGRRSSESMRTGNVEWFTFSDGLVTEVRSYYADTARCVALDQGSG